MALEIKENRGIFEILGNVSSQNLGALKIYFESALEQTNEMVISLEGIEHLDNSAALFFEKFYLEAVRQNKVVHLVGKQNKEITTTLNETNTNYILSSDRV